MASVEETVRRALAGADRSREGHDAEWVQEGMPPAPIDDGFVALTNLIELVRRQGRILPALAIDEGTSSEVAAVIQQARDLRPGALHAQVHGPTPASPTAILGDLTEMLSAHREAILRVANEQLDSIDEIEALFADAPIPGRDADQLQPSTRAAADADSDALILLAREVS